MVSSCLCTPLEKSRKGCWSLRISLEEANENKLENVADERELHKQQLFSLQDSRGGRKKSSLRKPSA